MLVSELVKRQAERYSIHRLSTQPLLTVDDWRRIMKIYGRLQPATLFTISAALSGHDLSPEQFRKVIDDPQDLLASLENKLKEGQDVSATITMMSWLLRGDEKLAGR